MKKLNKLMAIGLSLVMCLGMIAPAFATDAYYYVKVDQNDCPEIVTTHPAGDSVEGQKLDEGDLTGDGKNGDWAFMGKGKVDDETLKELELPIPDSEKREQVELADGVLPEGFEVPTEGIEQEFTGVVYHQPGQKPGTELNSVTVKTFHDIGQYKYDNEAEDTEVGQFTYTVTWENVEAQTGFNLHGSECTAMDYTGSKWSAYYNQNIEHETKDVSCVHVNGTATLHENQKAEVTIADYGKDAVTAESEKYVRQTAELNSKEAADALAGALTGAMMESGASAKQLNETNYIIVENKDQDTGKVTKTYTERTYTVTINANTDLSFAGVGKTTYGKAHGHGEVEAPTNRYIPGVGTYSFTGWTEEIDTEGNVIYTANVTFSPEYYDYDLGDTDVTIDDQAVPLAAGPVTRAEFIDYLWRHEGEPDSEGVCTFTDVEDTHEYFDALCWAEENGVAEAYLDAEGHEDGTFEPDELVTVAAVREFLGNFETVFGAQTVAAAELTTLTGEDGEAVLNCDQVLAEFFGEEYELPEDLDALEPDIAA